VSMPRRSMWRVAQFDTLRLRLIKVAARVVEMKTMIRIHLPTSCPKDILRLVARAYPAPRHLSDGAPRISTPSRQPANILHPAFWLIAGEDAVRPQASESEKITQTRWGARRNAQSAA
jgi:Transposase DDE domain group 1